MRCIVFDVETPNRYNNRMSAIGVSVVEDGKIRNEFFSYVDPEQPFDWFNTRLTGINEDTVAGAPSFPELWPSLEEQFADGVLVAHNASFDLSVLRSCLNHYGIDWKREVPFLCTVQLGKKLLPGMSHKLNDLCTYYDIPLDHHKADSDSHAAAEILLHYMDSGCRPEEHLRTYRFY